MGEEEKKPAEKTEEPPIAGGGDEKKAEGEPKVVEEESKDPPPPPPPQEIVLKVFMHCEGCARKVRRCLKDFDGVEDVMTDCKTHKVVVKGEKADPLKVLERVQKKSHRQVELISPIPPPPPPPAEEPEKPPEEVAKPEEKPPEPQVITVVLKAHMHCEACADAIKKKILRMKGVENVEPDFKNSQVAVKGVFDPQDLVDYVAKKTGKRATVVKVDPEKEAEEEGKDKKKGDGDGGDQKEGGKGGGVDNADAVAAAAAKQEEVAQVQEDPKLELKKNELYPYYLIPNYHQMNPNNQRIAQDNVYGYGYPQMFSDENPNACSVM